MALLPTVLGIAAQDYKPMLVNGREWTIGRTTIFPGADTTLITVKCVRDSIVGGKNCKVIRGMAEIGSSGTIISLSYLAYEDAAERKLYEWVDVVDTPFDPYNITTHKEFRVRIDFGITDFDDYSSMPVTTDSIEVKGIKYKRIIYPELAGNNRNIRIVEGIGSNFEYFAQDDNIYEVRPSDGSYFFLSKVVDNGEVIFEKEDFDAPSISHDHTPLLVDGLTWDCLAHHSFYGYRNVYAPFSLKIEGESVIDGKTYKDCYMQFEGKGTETERILYAHLREEGGKVYCRLDESVFGTSSFENLYRIEDWWLNSGALDTVYDGDKPLEFVLYDFENPQNMESISEWYFDDEYPESCLQWARGSEEVGGKQLTRYDAEYSSGEASGTKAFSVLESVGFTRFNISGFPLYALEDLTTDGQFIEPYTLRMRAGNVADSYEIIPSNYSEMIADIDALVKGYEYKPLIDENAELSYQIRKEGQENKDAHHYKLRMCGTTDIDGMTYTNVYRFDTEDFVPSLLTPRAFIREEGMKVYRRWNPEYVAQEFDAELVDAELAVSPSAEEVLLYDFAEVSSSSAMGRVADNYVEGYVKPGKEYFSLPATRDGLGVVEGVGIVGEGCGDMLCPVLDATSTITFGYRKDVTSTEYCPQYSSWIYIHNYQYWKFAGIDSVGIDSRSGVAGWYDLRGVRLTAKPATAGVYIVRLTDGTAKKVVVR